MDNINKQLDTISEAITTINATVNSINQRLEELIKALHDYDDDLSYEPQSGPCSKHDEASWDEIETNKRMDIIGQNGNEGIHYVTNEEADEDAKSNNTQTKHTGRNKKRNGGKKSAVVEHQKHPPHKH